MIKREAGIFLIVGSLTVLIDFLTYRSLLWLAWLSISSAKATGFLTGTIFSYFANRLWTFGHKEHSASSIPRFVFVYLLTLGVNVGINKAVLLLIEPFPHALLIAFVMATGTSAVLNFIGMKWFVFTGSKNASFR